MKTNRILTVCTSAMKITPEEFAEMDGLVQRQLAYLHPLKLATQATQNELGRRNTAVLIAVRALIAALNDALPAGGSS
jgi:hypothetical protein